MHTLNQAGEALQQERPADARRLLEQALAIEPDEPKGLNLLGLAYFKLGLLGGAKRVYDQLVERFPREAALHVNQGLVLLRQGRLTEAEGSLRRAIELDPEHRRAHCYLGLVLFRRGDLALAREHFVRGEAHDFARKVERRLTRLSGPRPSQHEQLSDVGERAMERLESRDVPFRQVEPNEDPIVRDEEAWEARVGHHQQIPVPELVDDDGTGSEEMDSAASTFTQATGSDELSQARAAHAELSDSPPDIEYDPQPRARERLSPKEVESLRSGLGRPGYVAGPGARAKLTLLGSGWLRPETVVLAFGDGDSLWSGPPEGPYRPLAGPKVVLTSVSGLAVALRQVQHAAVDSDRLVGWEGDFERRSVDGPGGLGRPAVLLHGRGSLLLRTLQPPLLVPLVGGQSVVCERGALVAWSLGLDVVGLASEHGGPVRCTGPGWIVVAEQAEVG